MASPSPSGVITLTHARNIKERVDIQDRIRTLLLIDLEAAVSVLNIVGHNDPLSSLPTTDL
jgi:hypothetical protein